MVISFILAPNIQIFETCPK